MRTESNRARTMLVVEDSNEDYAAISWAFRQARVKLKIVRVRDGDDALDYLNRRNEYAAQEQWVRPSLIWLDLNLPGTDGREVLERLKTDVHLCTIPVIIVTTSSNKIDIDFCYRQGANSFVVKPMSITDLVAMVTTINAFWVNTALVPN